MNEKELKVIKVKHVRSPGPEIAALAEQLFPGRGVRDMTLRFPFGGEATIEATFLMEPDDVRALLVSDVS